MFEVPVLQIPHLVAYIDGGTGSMLFQAAMGSILAVGYFTATQWSRLKSFFNNRAAKTSKPVRS